MQKINIIKILIFTIILSVFSFMPMSKANAIEYGGFGGRPAYPRADNPRTDSIFIHTLKPGDTETEGLIVVNNTKESKTMLIYGADSTPSSGGAFACKQLAEAKTDVGSWINMSKSEVTLEPGKNEIVPFTIAVPQNASTGEHNGCVLIQEKKDKVAGETGAVISVRTGLRVAITVPGVITRKLEIVGFTVDSVKDGYLLHSFVRNSGNVSIDADVSAVTRYFFGLTHFKSGGQFPILRGDTSEWNFELKKPFWGGLYNSSFTVEYDNNPEAVIGIKSDKSLTKLAGSTIWFFSFPTPLGLVIEIIIVLLFVAIGVFIYRFTRKRKK